jgi:signal transduction histidine kinase
MKIANIEAEYDLLLESKGGLVSDEGEIEKTSSALDKASKDRTPEEFKAFQESVNKRVEENEKELKKVIEVLKTVTLEIKNMKDAIRERTIDLEL